MIDRRHLMHFDWLTFSVTVSLALIGLGSIYSATYTRLPVFYQKEGYWIIIGIVLLVVAVVLNYTLLERLAYFIYGSTIALLVAVIFVGSSMGGARRWLDLGFFYIQPSELTKLALIIMLAKYFSERTLPERGLGVRELIVPGIFLLVPFALIAKQPDLGTAIILWMIFCSVLFAVKVRKRTIFGLVLLLGAIFPFAWKGLKGYQKARLLSFIDPGVDPLGTGYHLMQSKIAIGSGGLFGKGFTKGTQGKLMFLPEHHTDFIFSVLAEEWGLVGSLVIVSLFLTLIIRGLNAAESSKDRFGFLLAFGISAMFFWHVIINLGMVSGLMPVVGVPLPFISYGGSFLVTSMIAVGILINIKMRRFIF
jgi:rod shape determining protein RodA